MSDNGSVYEVRQDWLDVRSVDPWIYVPDETWVHQCACGQRHGWSADVVTVANHVVVDWWWCSDCRDEHERSAWVCSECGEILEPGYERRRARTHVAGLLRYLCDGVEITKAEYDAAMRS